MHLIRFESLEPAQMINNGFKISHNITVQQFIIFIN